jgi:hypothetical protein
LVRVYDLRPYNPTYATGASLRGSSVTFAGWADVEEALRLHAARATGPEATYYDRLTGVAQFWQGDRAIDCEAVEAKDRPQECQRIAVGAADLHCFEVVVGWAVAREHGPLWHVWNRAPEGSIVDAARARRVAFGYLGRVLTPGELSQLRAASNYPTATELAEHVTDRLAGFGRALASLLD